VVGGWVVGCAREAVSAAVSVGERMSMDVREAD
jgi:hypothetical protein